MAVEGPLFSGNMWRFDVWVACSWSRRVACLRSRLTLALFDRHSRSTITRVRPSRSPLRFLLSRCPLSLTLSSTILTMPPTTTTKSAPRKYGGKSKWDLRALGVVRKSLS